MSQLVLARLTYHGFARRAVVEWECYLKYPEDGAREAVAFVNEHLICATATPFDAFMRPQADTAANRRILGLT